MVPQSQLDQQFDPSPPNIERGMIHDSVRSKCKTLAEFFNEIVPDGREKALTLTHLEEAMMWANKGIANADRLI